MNNWNRYDSHNLPDNESRIVLSNEDGSEQRICTYFRDYIVPENVDPYVRMVGKYNDMFEYVEPCYAGDDIDPVWWMYVAKVPKEK